MRFTAPKFVLDAGVSQKTYVRWLHGRAVAHRNRDTKRRQKTGHDPLELEDYRLLIHAAVIRSRGVDEYTGDPMDWSLIGTWDNHRAKSDGAAYKRQHALKPTVDHVHADNGRPVDLAELRICTWLANDAKGDLSYEQLLDFCEKVLVRAGRLPIPGPANK